MRLIKQFTKYAAGSMLALLAGLITTPILTRLFSTVEMGKYSMFFTIGSLIASIMYLGLDQSYVRFYYEETEENRVSLLNVCLKKPLILSSVTALLIMFLYRWFSPIIIGQESPFLCLLFGLYLFGLVIDRFWMLKIRMGQKPGAYSVLNVVRKLSYLLFAVLLYSTFFGDSCWALMIGVTLAEAVLIAGAYFVERDNWRGGASSLHTSTHELIQYGYPFIFSTTITLIFHSTDKLMLKVLSDYNQIGLYSGAQSIVSLLTQVQIVFTTFWVPVAYEHYTQEPKDTAFFAHVNEIISYGMLIISILLLVTKDIIILFLGSQYRDAVYVFPFLLFMPIMYTVSETTGIGINFMKRSDYHVVISSVCALVNVFGNYFLIRRFGAVGAAISTGLAYIVFYYLRTVLSNKVYPVKYKIVKFSISCIIVYALAILASFVRVSSVFMLLAAVAVFVISILYANVLKEFISLIRMLISKMLNRKQTNSHD